MKTLWLIYGAFLGASAYPSLVEDSSSSQTAGLEFEERQSGINPSKAQTNCGPLPCPLFNEADQFVSTTGQHAYASPAAGDIRGPCPGLNAAANHGYISRSGVLTIQDTAAGLYQAFGFDASLGALLAVFGIVTSGDPIGMTWSIGGPQPYVAIGDLLAPPQGISYSHEKYEADVSLTRNDAYLDHGDAHSLNLTKFKRAFEIGMVNDRYTLDTFRLAYGKNLRDSIYTNPYYLCLPFSCTIISNGAYNFGINMFSNHSAEEPSGYLNGQMFKTFFAVSGTYPNFKWNKGQERIPENWYKRPSYNTYDLSKALEDVGIGYSAYPEHFRIGGNTNGPNTYQGVEIGSLSGNTYQNKDILKGNNLGCLALQGEEALIPDYLKGRVNDVGSVAAKFKKYITPVYKKLGCPQLAGYNPKVFNKYPGYKYNPKGPANNYK